MKSGGASGATQLMGLGQLRLEYRAGQQDLHVGSTRTLAAWTRVSVSSNPGWNPAMPGVSAASAARWPPAEPPVTTTKSGSPPCLPMCFFTQAMARFTSTIWAGQVSRGRAGSSTQHTHPPPLGQVPHQGSTLLLLASRHPRSAVHLDEHGRAARPWQVGPPPDIEVVPSTERPVGNVAGGGVTPTQRRQRVGDQPNSSRS